MEPITHNYIIVLLRFFFPVANATAVNPQDGKKLSTKNQNKTEYPLSETQSQSLLHKWAERNFGSQDSLNGEMLKQENAKEWISTKNAPTSVKNSKVMYLWWMERHLFLIFLNFSAFQCALSVVPHSFIFPFQTRAGFLSALDFLIYC